MVDVDLDRVRGDLLVEAVEPFLEPCFRHRHTGAAHQVLEHAELAPRQADGFAVDLDLAPMRRQAQVAAREVAVEHLFGPAHQGAQARRQLAEIERLGQEVVGAGVEAIDPRAQRAARRQDQDRRPDWAFAQAFEDLDPVHVGQAEIKDQGVVPDGLGGGQAVLAARDVIDRKAVRLQADPDQLGEAGIVFDQQDAHGARGGRERLTK